MAVDQGAFALTALRHPGAVADHMAAQGILPPGPEMQQQFDTGQAGGLASLLNPVGQSPLAGLKAPPAPAVPHLAAPGVPQPGQAIDPSGGDLMKILLGSLQASAAPDPRAGGGMNLAALLGR